jgi:hypothetical protein
MRIFFGNSTDSAVTVAGRMRPERRLGNCSDKIFAVLCGGKAIFF